MTGARRDLPPAVTVKQIINRRLRYLAANLFLESRLYPADFQNAAVFSGVTKTLKPRCFFPLPSGRRGNARPCPTV